jgi:hypothetical protein
MLYLNRFFLVSALAAAAAASNVVFAEDITIDARPFVSSRSPAETLAELRAFKASGVNPWSTSYNPLASFKSAKTRGEVQTDFLSSRNETSAFMGEDSGSAYLAAHSRVKAPTQIAGRSAAAQ